MERHGADAKVAVLPYARYQLPRNAVRMEPADEPCLRPRGPHVADVGGARRTIPGLRASGVAASDATPAATIRGSTTILEILRMFPDGRAAQLMSAIYWPCAHCGGAVREPLTMAAMRHRRDPRAVLDAFRALEPGGPDEEQVARAAPSGRRAPAVDSRRARRDRA